MEQIKETLKNQSSIKSGLELIQSNQQEEIDYSARRKVWLRDAGIPLRYLDKTLENLNVSNQNRQAVNACKKYVTEFPLRKIVDYKSLAITSNKIWGVGKTHLACAIAKELINRCQFENPVIYLTEPELLSRLRASFNKNDGVETEDSLMKRLTTIPLLIIDDVGKEEVADPRFVQRVWFNLINTRYDNLLPVMITANLDPDQISHHLGGSRANEATFDRLYEMLEGTFWEIIGESYRRKQWIVGT